MGRRTDLPVVARWSDWVFCRWQARDARHLEAQLEEAKAKRELAKQSGKDDGTNALLLQASTPAPTEVAVADSGMPSSKTIYIGLGVLALLGVAYFGFGKKLGIKK